LGTLPSSTNCPSFLALPGKVAISPSATLSRHTPDLPVRAIILAFTSGN
jgi:hypothetical protein